MKKVCFYGNESRGIGDLPNKQILTTGPVARRENFGSLLADFFLARPHNIKTHHTHPNTLNKQKRKTTPKTNQNASTIKTKMPAPEVTKKATIQRFKICQKQIRLKPSQGQHFNFHILQYDQYFEKRTAHKFEDAIIQDQGTLALGSLSEQPKSQENF